MATYLACFDISDDRIRRTVSKRLEHFGQRVQYSVFEISVKSPQQLERLKQEMQLELEEDDDLRFYFLCKACRKKSCTHNNERIAYYPAAVIV